MTWKDNSARYEKDTTRVVLPRRKKNHDVAIAKIQLEAQFASTHAYAWSAICFAFAGVLFAIWGTLFLNYPILSWVTVFFGITLASLAATILSLRKYAQTREAELLKKLDGLN